jgi:hypothetical protein
MKNKILSIGAVVLLIPLTSVWAVNLSGNWIAQLPSSQGVVETIFCFKEKGKELTGKVTAPDGETVISDGEIDGDEISFIVKRSVGGTQIIQRYKGKVAGRVYGDEIEFILEEQDGDGEPYEFIAKREFPLGDYSLPMKGISLPQIP